MSSTTHTNRNLAARMGRWSARHWKTATFGWLAFVLVAFGLGGMVGTTNIDQSSGPGESGRMNRILEAGFEQPASENVLIQSRAHRVGTPVFDAAIADVVARVSKVAAVRDVRSPLDPANAGQISKDRRSALVEFAIRGDKEDAVDEIGPVLDTVAAAGRAHPAFTIGEFGDASAEDGVVKAYEEDLGKAGMLSLPITLIVLVLTFGSLVAAGIPLLLALTAVFATFGLVALSSLVSPVAMQAPAMVLLIGLAVGVDYSMFYLKREQQRDAGRHQRAERQYEDEQRDRKRELAGLAEVIAVRVLDALLRARVAELADREAGVGRLRGRDRVEDRLHLVDRLVLVALDREVDEGGVVVLRDRAALHVLHGGHARDVRDDVRDRGPEGRRSGTGGAAPDQDVLVGRLLEAVVEDPVHAAGLTRPAVLVDVPRPHHAAKAEGDEYEGEPAEGGRLPVTCTPATHAGRQVSIRVRGARHFSFLLQAA